MNLLPCDLDISISNLDGSYNKNFEISANLNSIVYDLTVPPESKQHYNIEVKTSDKCPENLSNKISQLKFLAEDETVYGFIVRSLDEKVNIMAMKEAEEPKKLDDAAPRFRWVDEFFTSFTYQEVMIEHNGK